MSWRDLAAPIIARVLAETDRSRYGPKRGVEGSPLKLSPSPSPCRQPRPRRLRVIRGKTFAGSQPDAPYLQAGGCAPA